MSVLKRLLNIAKSELSDRFAKEEGPSFINRDNVRDVPPSSFREEPTDEEKYYANLELPKGASLQEVRKAHRTLLKKYHPDFHGNDEDKRQTAELIIQQLNEARNYFEEKLKE